jgi:chromosome segregation ATPase
MSEVQEEHKGDGPAPSEIGTPADDSRLQSILKVDTNALLQLISRIEHDMTMYQKQDDVPSWGQGLSAKVDLLEKMVNRTPRGDSDGGVVPEPSPFIAGAGGASSSLKTHGKNDDMLNKLRKEMSHHATTAATAFDSKMNSLSMELDRMHKLLQIRPTTSELQQVVLSIHDIDRKVEDGVRDVKKNVRGQVHDKVSEEMASIIANVQSTADINAQSIGLIAKKVDAYSGDITSIRKATEQACDTMSNNIKKCMYDMQASKELVLQLQERADTDAATADQGIKSLQFAQNMASEKLDEVKSGIKEDFDKFNKVITDQDAQVKDLLSDSAAKLGEMTIITTATKKDLDDFRLAYEVDVKLQQESNADVLKKVSDLDGRFTEVSEYVLGLKDADIMNMIELQNDQITTLKTSIEDTEASLSSISNKMTKVQKTVSKCSEDMEKLPAMVQSANDRVNDLTLESEQLREKSEQTRA